MMTAFNHLDSSDVLAESRRQHIDAIYRRIISETFSGNGIEYRYGRVLSAYYTGRAEGMKNEDAKRLQTRLFGLSWTPPEDDLIEHDEPHADM